MPTSALVRPHLRQKSDGAHTVLGIHISQGFGRLMFVAGTGRVTAFVDITRKLRWYVFARANMEAHRSLDLISAITWSIAAL